jgi:hypothetical protein
MFTEFDLEKTKSLLLIKSGFLSNVLPIDIYEKKLCNIYVNGDWIGLCNDAFEFTIKYRQKRRNFEIMFHVK